MLNNDRSKAAPEPDKAPPLRLAEQLSHGKILIALGTFMIFVGFVLCSTTMTVTTENIIGEPIDFLTEGLWLTGVGTIIGIIGGSDYLKAVLEIGFVDDFI